MAKAFGLDISDYSIEALVLSGKADKPKVTSSKRIILERGMVVNGEVKRRKGLSTILKKVITEAGPKKITDKEVIIGVPDSRVMTHIFQLPANLKEDQIIGIIENELENIFPIKTQEVYWDYKIIKHEKTEIEVFVAVIDKKIINGLLRVCQDIGLKPIVFELEASALARILIPKSERINTLLLDLGAKTTKLSYFDNEGINFISVIDIAGEQFTEKIGEKLGISEIKAKGIKKKNGIILPKGKRKNKVLDAIAPDLRQLVKDIEKNKDFCEKRSNTKINKIVLSGGTAMMPGLVDYLKEKLKIDVRIGVELVNIGTKNSRVRGPLFFAVAGLALRGFEKNCERTDINLLPSKSRIAKPGKEKSKKNEPKKEKIKKEGSHKKTWMLLIILIVALIILGGVLFAYQQGYLGTAKKETPQQAEQAKQVQSDATHVVFSDATIEVDVSGLEVNTENTIKGKLNEFTVEGTQTFNTSELSKKTSQVPAEENTVSQTNINLAKEELVNKLVSENINTFQTDNSDYVVIPDVIDYNIVESTTSVTPGTTATDFEIALKARPVLLMISRGELLEELNKNITNDENKVQDSELDGLKYTIINYYRNSGIIKLTVKKP